MNTTSTLPDGVPKRYADFAARYPDVFNAYNQLGEAVHAAGPLDAKTRALLKLAISSAAGREGAVHAHTRKALLAGCLAEEIRQTILLTIPTVGFPAAMSAMSWVDDVLEAQ